MHEKIIIHIIIAEPHTHIGSKRKPTSWVSHGFLACGIARGRVRTTTVESRKMAAILQIITVSSIQMFFVYSFRFVYQVIITPKIEGQTRYRAPHLKVLNWNQNSTLYWVSLNGLQELRFYGDLWLRRTGNYQIHEFDWLKWILTAKMQNHWLFSSNNIYFCKCQRADERTSKLWKN